ncbi:MAG: sugar transferase [Fimbriimonadaceae bacterium]
MARRVYLAVKYALEPILALVLLIVLFPVMVLLAIGVKLSSPGPVLYMQERVGLKGRVFKILKFRSMRVDAEDGTGPVWSVGKDPRATPFGSWMRKTHLDELPQLFNVLMLQMVFVGPRPERPVFVEQFRETIDHYDERHNVKPGITGWAQVNQEADATLEDVKRKVHFDREYIDRVSLLFDLKVVARTVMGILGLTRAGDYDIKRLEKPHAIPDGPVKPQSDIE